MYINKQSVCIRLSTLIFATHTREKEVPNKHNRIMEVIATSVKLYITYYLLKSCLVYARYTVLTLKEHITTESLFLGWF